MNREIVPNKTNKALARQGLSLPAIIEDAGENASRKFVEFFVARMEFFAHPPESVHFSSWACSVRASYNRHCRNLNMPLVNTKRP